MIRSQTKNAAVTGVKMQTGNWPFSTLMQGFAFAVAMVRRLRVDDEGRLRSFRGPLIVVSNHGSRLDSIFYHRAIGANLIVCGARPVYFKNVWRRLVMRLMNVRQVVNHDQFVAECCELLKLDQVLLLYPEMKTNPAGLGTFREWAAEVAIRSGATVVPCSIHSINTLRMKPVTIAAGQPIDPTKVADAKALTQLFREHIAGLSRPGTR